MITANVWVWRILIVGTMILAWEFASPLGWMDADLLPPFSRVMAEIGSLLANERFRHDIYVTVFSCLSAFIIVVPLGLACGFVLGESQAADKSFGPLLQLLMTVPKSVFLPLFILFFGIGIPQKVVFAVVLAFFIVVPTGRAAVHSVPRGLVVAARSFGANRFQIYRDIYAPAAAPLVMSGVRLGLIFSIHGVIFAEMYASWEGIGRHILTWGESYQMTPLLAAVSLILIATVILNESMQLVETQLRKRLSAGVVK